LHFEVRDRDYDFIIAAPGPTVNHLQGCYEDKDSPNEIITTIWFGVGVSERDDVIRIISARPVTIKERVRYENR
jgi:hypothetical protein